MKKFILFSVLMLICVYALCPEIGLAVQAPPNPTYETNLSISPSPILGQQCTLTLTIKGLIDSPNTHVFIDIPEGVTVVSGALDFYRDIAKDETYTHVVIIQVIEQGKYNFLAIVKSQVYRVNYSEEALAELHIVSSDTSASVYEKVDESFYQTEELDTLNGTTLKKITPEYEYPLQEFVEGATITISGTIKYKNKDTGAYIPFPHAKVRVNNYVTMCCNCPLGYPCCNCPMPFNLCEITPGIPCGSLYPNPFIPREVVVYTDANGHYTVSGWPAGSNTMVSVLMDNDVAYIANDGDGRFPEIYTQNWVNSNLVVNMNLNYSEPARILHNLYKAFNWCSNKLGWTRGKAKVNYYHSAFGIAEFVYNGDEYINYYERWGHSYEIWASRGRSVIAHEYGHAVMYKAYGNNLPAGWGPDPHYINSVSSPGFALVEGWAEFFSQAVYMTETVNEYGYDYLTLESLYEQASWYGCPYWKGQDCNNDNGGRVEGAVASVLWDLYDSPSTLDESPGEDEDDAIGLYSSMWNVFLNGILSNLQGQQFHVQSIYHFWCVWKDEDPTEYIYIFKHAPGPQSIDAIYNYDLFGISPFPAVPSNLSATAVSSSQINLTWTDNSSNESGFKIERKTGMIGTWSLIATVGSNVTSYINTGLSSSTTYCYRVRAYNAFGNSDTSNSDCATTHTEYVGCPFVYVWNGNGFEEDNTILSACEVNPGKPINDYYLLSKPLVSSGEEYRLQIKEFEDELSYLDHVKLIAVDHSSKIKAGITPEGEIFGYDKELVPIACVNQNGDDCFSEIKNKDGLYFASEVPGYLIVTYSKKAAGQNALYNPSPIEPNVSEPPPPPAEKRAGVVSVLTVEVQDINGTWHTLGNIPPKYYPYRTFWVLDDTGVELGEEFKMKLSWDHYYAADQLKYYIQSTEKPVNIWWGPISAANSERGEVLKELSNIDEKYAILMPGENIELSFPAYPISQDGMVRDFVLQTVGYYVSLSKPVSSPTSYALLDNYPNPFNPSTTILYTLPEETYVKLEVYNILGQSVRVLVEEHQSAGYKTVIWDGKNDKGESVSSGVYFYRLQTEGYTNSKKMLLMK